MIDIWGIQIFARVQITPVVWRKNLERGKWNSNTYTKNPWASLCGQWKTMKRDSDLLFWLLSGHCTKTALFSASLAFQETAPRVAEPSYWHAPGEISAWESCRLCVAHDSELFSSVWTLWLMYRQFLLHCFISVFPPISDSFLLLWTDLSLISHAIPPFSFYRSLCIFKRLLNRQQFPTSYNWRQREMESCYRNAAERSREKSILVEDGEERRIWRLASSTHVWRDECSWGLGIKKQLACVLRETSACGGFNYIWNWISRLSKFTICFLNPSPAPCSSAHWNS